MPLELGIWRIDGDLQKMEFEPLDFESRLQDILATDLSIVDPNLMIIGREVRTNFDKRVDILAINQDGHLVIVELKRDKTPRDIVAQTLEYGAWVRHLQNDEIARIYEEYQQKYIPNETDKSIDQAFYDHFRVKEMPDELNQAHELVIVASSLDATTERIVQYLAEEYEVNINAVFFRVFKDDDREYLSRAWLRDPQLIPDRPEPDRDREWNGEYYVSFGHDEERDWNEAVKYGFFSAGGGAWYTNTLNILEPGARIWANVPGTGYVGVGTVTEAAVVMDEFMVDDGNDHRIPFDQITKVNKAQTIADVGREKAEYMVRVDWIKTVPISHAIKEKGFFGNQNSAARPKDPKWHHTVERLKKRFAVK